MGSFNVNPTTILGKIHVRTPTQAESLSSRYSFLNINNAEPNLGRPPEMVTGGSYYSSLTSSELLGIRYALLSNNHSGSAWRVWAYDNPKIATYSKEGSMGVGDNAFPLNIKSFVYSNYAYDNQNNRYNSQSFSNKSFNVFALSGIYLFNSTTIGDPASAIAFIITDTGSVGIGTENPPATLSIIGTISGSNITTSFNASSATGLYSFANIAGRAFGDYSYAECGGLSLGEGSHSEGDATTASGSYSHAEGGATEAAGQYGHAEGGGSKALGFASHAEGDSTEASGDSSHAEGISTRALGDYTHAEGEETIASGYNSHAAGRFAQAAHDRTWIWKGSTRINLLSTTRTDQFMVSAEGGIYLVNRVGIGTDNNTNALTVAGVISASGGLDVPSISSRFLDLIHIPANDGINPIIRIGEYTPGNTALSGFSGMFISYNETTNVFGISSQFAPAAGVPAVDIDRFGNLTIYGTVSGKTITTAYDGKYNTAVGYSALESKTTGGYNTALGNQALQKNTTGGGNTAIGEQALRDNLSTNANTAVGAGSMLLNQTGQQNTAIGDSSLQSNVTGSYNLAVGQNALRNCTVSENTAVGQSALYLNVTGTGNTAIGKSALEASTASNNTAVGSYAMEKSSTGIFNTAVGKEAMNKNTTADNNVAVGHNALYSNRTNAYNTAIGSQSMFNAGGSVAACAQNTVVGTRAMFSSYGGSSNTIIGSQASESDTTGDFNTILGANATHNNKTRAVAIGAGTIAGADGTLNIGYGMTDLVATSSGSANGLDLIIYLNGTRYRIALKQ